MSMVYGTYLKHIKYCKNGCVFSFKPFGSKFTYTLVGNVPRIDNLSGVTTKSAKSKKEKKQGASLTMGVDFADDYYIKNNYPSKNALEVTDYKIESSDRNIERLKTLGYDIKDFNEEINFHKRTKILWRNLSKSRVPYEHFEFKQADDTYKRIGGFYESDTRLNAINSEIIKEFRNKDQYSYTLEEYVNMFRKVERNGAFAKVSHNAILTNFVKNKGFLYDGFYVYDKEVKEANEYIKNRFARNGFSTQPFIPIEIIEEYIKEHPYLSDEQKEVLRNLQYDNILIVSGKAGGGKTSVIKDILAIYKKFFGFDVGTLLLAPTGKASRRIATKCDCSAFTVHHALRKSLESDYIHFKESNPFPERLFIIDESSMLDTLLMRDLLRAISSGSKAIFVGDYRQLEAVGVGSPFHEMIDSGLCKVINLTKIFRQSNDTVILDNAEAVLDGQMFFEGNGVSIKEIALSEIGDYINDNTVNISPYRKIVSDINQTMYNKHKDDKKFQNEFYYKGCKVVFNKNTDKYANGDTGVVKSFDDNLMQVAIDDTNEVISVDRDDLDNMTFGYALTTHKVQGSEYDSIKLFLPKELTVFSANPNMLYTMITRAKKNVEIYYYTE